MRASRLATVFFAMALLIVAFASESFAGTKLYQGSWIAESFGNDKVGIGTKESKYFEVAGIPLGNNCHPNAPLCDFYSTQVTTTGTPSAPGATGTLWNPLGPKCRPLASTELPRPALGNTLTPSGATCPFTATYGTQHITPCNKTAPLYRNKAFFTPTSGLLASNQSCSGAQTVSGAKAVVPLLTLDNPLRGKVMKGHPLTGSQSATTTGASFNFPAAPASPGPGNGMFRTTKGSFVGEGPYRYSYTYAQLRNDAGSFGPGKGFFSVAAPTPTLSFKNKVGANYVATMKVRPGANKFGGVMKLLGSYTTKVCYFYAGGCGLGYGTWDYELIGAAGYKNSATGSKVVTAEYTTNFVFTYYNTELGTIGKYDIVAQRFPWTTGKVTVSATVRGPNNTFEQREGFDNRVDGVGTVQLVSPILTQWLSQFGGGEKFETGGIAVMQIKFVPEPGGVASLVAGLSMLWVLRRFRS
jgi:hypothetical protein